MAYVTPEAIVQARQMDLLTYLQNFEPQELVKISPGNYCTREHDSLKISNGKWHWFSRGFGGTNALDYLIKVKDYPFTEAVEAIMGKGPIRPSVPPAPKPAPIKQLQLPEMNPTTYKVQQYLRDRGIHQSIIDFCIRKEILFESSNYHNAVFVGRDKEGVPRYASLRGTLGNFKNEASGSDKHYSFSIVENTDATTVHIFESAIDLMSFATLRLFETPNWKEDALLSLAGVFKTKRENVVPIALAQFLKDHPQVHTLRLHLDNDEVGRGAAQGIIGGLGQKYTVIDDPPPRGKDVNEYLQFRVGLLHRKEMQQR